VKIVICTMGFRGDVEPYIALGIELAKLGYTVYISAPIVYQKLVEEARLSYLAMNAVNPQDMMKIPEIEQAFASGKKIKPLILLMKKSKPVISEFLKEMYRNTQGMDAVIATMILYGAYDGAEKQEIPCIYTLLNPAVPTSEFSTVVAPHIPRLLYRASHKCLEKGFWLCFKKTCNILRKTEWGLAKLNTCPIDRLRKNNVPTLLGYSETIIPKPKDWSENEIVTGYWQREPETEYKPNSELVEFLNSGERRPIYIGFGSMPIGNVNDLLTMIKEALDISHERAVVFLSYNKNVQLEHDGRIFLIDSIPHNWLFPKVSATVIHGGAGTCAASIKAGKPTIVIPFMGDQFFWGEQIHKRGLGPKPIPYKSLNALKVAELIKETVLNKQMIENAKHIGEILQKENGSALAAEKIHLYLQKQNQRT
jgi:sterol 3beta-glucosyltransferase